MHVKALKKEDINGILDKWLAASKRSLTKPQRSHVVSVIEKSPQPLYLKLCFDEALRWHSYDHVNVTRLQATVEKMINALFQRVEKTHGTLMVSRALSYLTVGRVTFLMLHVKQGQTIVTLGSITFLCDTSLS